MTIDRVQLTRQTHSAMDLDLNGVLDVRDSIIYANRTTYGGGALSVTGALALSIQNTTIAKTKPRRLYPSGGNTGIRVNCVDSVVDIHNTIVWEPRGSDFGSAVQLECDNSVGSVSYNGFDAEPVVSDGIAVSDNLIGTPGLRKGAHLRRDSLLVDAGICAGTASTDFEGDPRPSGAGCDIGADETIP